MLGLVLACGSPVAGSTSASVGASTTGAPSPTSTTGGAEASTGSSPPINTFGMDGPLDDGAEVGFVGPLDLACGPGTASPRAPCALCDVREQNCVDDFKCVAWAEDGGDAWTGTKCIGVSLDPVGIAEPCTVVDGPASGRDDCARGSMCWDVDPSTLQGVCVPFCGPDDGEASCPAGTRCLIDDRQILALCRPPCDPLDPVGCGAGESCRFLPASGAAFCIPESGGVVLSGTIQCGDPLSACASDRTCVSAKAYGGCGAPSCCTSWCRVDDPGADAQCAGQRPAHACVSVFGGSEPTEGYQALGRCVDPG